METIAATSDTPVEQFASAAEQAAYFNAQEAKLPARGASSVEVVAPEPIVEIAPEPDAAVDAKADDKAEPIDVARNETGQFAKKGKPRDDPKARVEQATSQAAAAKEEARLAKEEARLAKEEIARIRAEAAKSAEPKAVDAAPVQRSAETFPDFATWSDKNAGKEWEDYLDARTEFRVEQRIRQYDAQQTHAAKAKAVIEAGTAKYKDFADVVRRDVPVSAVMRAALLDSPQSADIAYYLGTHPEEALQLAQQSKGTPVDAAYLMRLHLESLVKPPAAGTTGPAAASVHRPAASPIEPVRTGSPAATVGPPGDDASAAEHAAYWNRAEREAKARR